MSIEGIKTAFVYLAAFTAGIVASLVSLISPMQQELPQLLKQPAATPALTEETRILSKEEQATMSASFIKEFEVIQSSGSGTNK